MTHLKLIAAAVALAAAGAASANVLDPLAAGGVGGEMSLTVFSQQAGVSFLFDTGVMLGDFRAATTQGQSYSASLVGNSAFESFLSIYNAAGASDMRWTFFGGDNSGVSAATRTMISTISGDASVVTNGSMVTGMNNIKTNYLDVANLNPQLNVTLGGSANGSGVFQQGVDGKAYFLDTLGPDFMGVFQNTSNALGSSSNMYDFVRSSTSALGDATESLLGTAVLSKIGDGYTFTATAVPEPSTYALLIAGLAVAGRVASRRRAAK